MATERHETAERHETKRISFLGQDRTILLQNTNGPCPLLAIVNALILRGQLSIHADYGSVDIDHLIALVGDRLIEANPPPEDPTLRANLQRNVSDVMSVLPKLRYGLDVNVRFQSITDFEFTPECATFDLLDLRLVHGWLLDPQDRETAAVVGVQSYNQLVERIIAGATAATPVPTSPPVDVDVETPVSGEVHADPAPATEEEEEEEDGKAQDGNQEARLAAPAGVKDTDSDSHSQSDTKAGSSPSSPLAVEAPVVAETPAAAGAGSSPGPVASSSAAAAPPPSPPPSIHQPPKSPTMSPPALSPGALERQHLRSDGQVIRSFLDSTASQLTYYGLLQLHRDLKDRELSVFFRNNHFSTVFKLDGALYLLVTDIGFRRQPNVVWERLDEIDGDTVYVNSEFRVPAQGEVTDLPVLTPAEASVAVLGTDLVDPDFLLALEVQQSQEATPSGPAGVTPGGGGLPAAPTPMARASSAPAASSSPGRAGGAADTDYLLAMQLQQREQRGAAAPAVATRGAQATTPGFPTVRPPERRAAPAAHASDDYALALQMQEQERAAAEAELVEDGGRVRGTRRGGRSSTNPRSDGKKKKRCVVQ